MLTLVDDEDEVASSLTDLRGVTVLDLDRLAPDSDVFHVFLLSLDTGPFVLETLLETEAIPHQIRIAGDRLVVGASVSDWDHLKELGEAIERTHGRFELAGVTETDHPGFPFGGAALTHVVENALADEQLELLETAYERGFFELPRRASETDLAAELGVSQSTVSERIRSAQQSLLDVVFGRG